MEIVSWQKGDYKPSLLISPLPVVRACVKGTEDSTVPRTAVLPQKLRNLGTGVKKRQLHRERGRLSKRALGPPPVPATLGSPPLPPMAWLQPSDLALFLFWSHIVLDSKKSQF